MLFIVRGLSGAGKSTRAAKLATVVVAADDWFERDGEYRFNPRDLPAAHQDCQRRTREALLAGKTVAVANTFTQRWEMQPYLDMVKEIGCPFTVVDLFDGGLNDDQLADRNVHGVPMVAIRGMRERYEHDWTKGDPRAPWER